MWPLSEEWYGDRLHPDYSAKPIDELQGMLTRAGLTGPFWSLV